MYTSVSAHSSFSSSSLCKTLLTWTGKSRLVTHSPTQSQFVCSLGCLRYECESEGLNVRKCVREMEFEFENFMKLKWGYHHH